jgi:hypothetical protein
MQSSGALKKEPINFKRLMVNNIVAERSVVNMKMKLKISAEVEVPLATIS